MTTVIASGKTVDDAIAEGLAQLNTTKEYVNVTVLQAPSKGFLGLIGVKSAKVELTLLDVQPLAGNGADRVSPSAPAAQAQRQSASSATVEAVPVMDEDETEHTPQQSSGSRAFAAVEACDEAAQFIRDVGDSIGLELDVDVKRGRDGYVMSISGSDLGLLIGRRGQTLDALQYLVNIVANRYSDKYIRIMLDAENFRDRRRKTLEELADRLAGKVIRSGKEVVLEPMSSQERKVIHARLQNHTKVKTASKGDEPNRRVVITLR
ncbi:RNA-binding cell elongation regulator Jag/EloR [Paenibacillus campi]|uniref:RNA-binding cell elongation regulator Jag/EloR n=1 Tax=Paenibacillus campi TaxID=3106031 RepID=UPI002AFDEE4A|nr:MULTISPECIES: RNA-binding cell elongation regulator Jag/EloR [unclassified Paenibacillus]